VVNSNARRIIPVQTQPPKENYFIKNTQDSGKVQVNTNGDEIQKMKSNINQIMSDLNNIKNQRKFGTNINTKNI